MAASFVKALPAMNRAPDRFPRPFVASVTRGGSVSVFLRERRGRAHGGLS
ncbi:MAG: hypothetical protein ACREIU_16090 [Planctomycetota bacterium]